MKNSLKWLKTNQIEVDKERILFKDFLTYTKFFEGMLSTAANNWQESLGKIFTDLRDSGLPLTNDNYDKLADLKKELNRHKATASLATDHFTFPVPQAAFRLRGSLDGYKGKERQVRMESLRKSGPGNLVRDTKEFIDELSDIVGQIYKESGCVAESGDTVRGPTASVKKLVDIMLAGVAADKFIARLDEILTLSKQRQDAAERMMARMDQHVKDLVKTPELDDEEARYEKLMEPVDKTLQRFSIGGEEVSSKQTENEKNILIDALEKSLRSNLRDKNGSLTTRGAQHSWEAT